MDTRRRWVLYVDRPIWIFVLYRRFRMQYDHVTSEKNSLYRCLISVYANNRNITITHFKIRIADCYFSILE